jgi:serine/threonine protein phosphatase 1
MYNQLNVIFSRILPLRKSDGIKDKIIFLGDYIDRNINSHKVIDIIIEIKNDFPNQVICLQGNHELLFKDAISNKSTLEQYLTWMHNGGSETLLGYMERSNIKIENPFLMNRQRIKQIIPDEHVRFLNTLSPYYEDDEHIFVHGGCDPMIPLSSQDPNFLAWDRSVYHSVLGMTGKLPWNKRIVVGHSGKPGADKFVADKFVMIDGSKSEMLYIFEMNTGEGFSARKGKNRLVKEKLCSINSHQIY